MAGVLTGGQSQLQGTKTLLGQVLIRIISPPPLEDAETYQGPAFVLVPHPQHGPVSLDRGEKSQFHGVNRPLEQGLLVRFLLPVPPHCTAVLVKEENSKKGTSWMRDSPPSS